MRNKNIKKNGIKSKEEIISYLKVINQNSDSIEDYLYYQVVEFTDLNGKTRKV